jgi:hypothetical protein
MPVTIRGSLGALLACALVLCLTTGARAHEKEDEGKPPPPVRLMIVAPSAQGPWLLRIDNDGDAPVRVAADVRLLRLHVRGVARTKGRVYAHGWSLRETVCDGPTQFGLADHFPADRELVLDAGHSYVEEFDPRLICFGKNADLLTPGAQVKAYLGWKPNKGWRSMSAAPFVADDAHVPRRFRPLRRLEAPLLVLSHGPAVEYGSDPESQATPDKLDSTEPDAGDGEDGEGEVQPPPKKRTHKSADDASVYRPKPVPAVTAKPPLKDELAASLTLTATRFDDASRPTDIQLSVQAHNSGERPIFVALRSRMLSFVVSGPDGVVPCKRKTENNYVARDHFRTLHHGKHVHLSVMLAELCPPNTFDRPGLYAAAPVLHVDADGREYGLMGLTGTVTARDPGRVGGTHRSDEDTTLIRIRQGRLPFYKEPPVQVPTRVLPP